MAQGTTKGVPIDTDPTLAADSDLLVPSQKAVKSYAQPQLNGTGFVKATGTTISYDNSTYLTSVGTGVANQLTYWSGTNTISSLTTATYPSLTELSYVKGVTSAIQTQLSGKGYTISAFTGLNGTTFTPVNAATYYFGNQARIPTTTAAIWRLYIQRAGTIKRADFVSATSTTGTGENISLYIRLNNTTDTLVATVGNTSNPRLFQNSSLAISVVAGDYIEMKMICPTWATQPTGFTIGGQIYIE
jgi:hypothetical protein